MVDKVDKMDNRITDLERRIKASELGFDSELFGEYYRVMSRAGRLCDFQGYTLLPSQYEGILKVCAQYGGLVFENANQLSVEFGIIREMTCYSSNSSRKLIMPNELNYLRYLDLWGNTLYHLDVSKLKLLNFLDCGDNRLRVLELNGAKELDTLWCAHNLLEKLDLSCAPSLAELDCSNNDLGELNIGKNSNLEFLDCTENHLQTLNTEENKKLRYLDLRSNPLSDEEIEKIRAVKCEVLKFIFRFDLLDRVE